MSEKGYYRCDSCHLDNKECAAREYCQACEEKLCTDCVERHRRRKATSLHKPVSIQEVITNETSICKPSININKLSKAKLKCLPLCYKLPHSEESISGDYARVETSRLDTINKRIISLCDICKENNDTFRASFFCKLCDEKLCKDCTKKHLIRKATETHTLACVAVLEYEKEKVYGNPAVNVCTVCREALCEHCTETHKQKKNHTRQSIQLAPDKYSTCDQCKVAWKMYEPQNTRVEELWTTELVQPTIKDCPGKPVATNIFADSIALTWEPPSRFGDDNYYQIMYKEIDRDKNWKQFPGKFYTESAVLNGLRSNTAFKFRVRAIYEDDDGPSSVDSDKIATLKSPASRYAECSDIVKVGNPSPSVYAVPLKMSIEHFSWYGMESERTYEIGDPPGLYCKSKTILLVGAPGSDKSTLVDALINYVLGVSWDDPYRFTVSRSEDDFMKKARSVRADSTCYTVNPEKGGRLPYQLRVIEGRSNIFDYLYEPFIDAVCFVVRAPEARLTAEQRLILDFFELEDINSNMCTFVTFADGNTPPVISALKESGQHFGGIFTFNNSSLFAENENISNMTLSRGFWDMGFKSFTTFFDHIENMETGHIKSMTLTFWGKEIFNEIQTLEAIMKDAQLQFVKLLSTACALTQKGYDIKDNPSLKSSFRCKVVTETFKKIIELPDSEKAYHCISCKLTCYDTSSKSKYQHGAMNENGACDDCPRKCPRENHYHSKYKFETVNVTRYEQISLQDNDTAEKQIAIFNDSLINAMVDDLYNIVCSVITYDKKLKEITFSLKLNFHEITVGDHIDEMIADEKQERKEGFLIRINILNDLLRKHESDLRKRQHSDLQEQERVLRKEENELREKERELTNLREKIDLLERKDLRQREVQNRKREKDDCLLM